MRKRTLTLLLIFIGLVFIIVVFVIYGLFTHRMLYVPSGMMKNTVIPGDRLFARKLFNAEVKRGQIVVYQYPGDSTFYLGRVIGMPNETLELRDTSVVINNNQRLVEQRVTIGFGDPNDPLRELSTEGKGVYKVFYDLNRSPDPDYIGPYQIPAGHYFVLGDNRDDSEDSRYRGTVPRELICCEAFMIYFSTEVTTDEFRWDRLFKKIR